LRAIEASSPDTAHRELDAIERSKYSLRVLILLYTRGPATFNELVRQIPTSRSTAARSLRQLESEGFILNERETDGRRRRIYRVTATGGVIAATPPCVWSR
jgi:DNA-binding MarR family transcriptional regulator